MKLKYAQAKVMRKALTPPEFILWHSLKVRQSGGPIFRRQYAFGPYILDFYCIRARLAVEVDGHHHGTDEGMRRDEVRDAFLKAHGVFVYHIPAADIYRDLDSVALGVWDLAERRLEEARDGKV